ncbi:MAG: helix-turn-helix domain-containing protein [Elusimicrobiota bacterium]
MRPAGSRRLLENRRRRAMRLLEQGTSFRSAAAATGASLSSVVRWRQAYRRGGAAALRGRPSPGRPGRLSPAQRRRLGAVLRKEAPRGRPLKLVGRLIEREFGLRYSLSGVWRLTAAVLKRKFLPPAPR